MIIETVKEKSMYQLQVENMSCGHCVGAVTKAVQALSLIHI